MFYRSSVAKMRIYFVDTVTFKVIVDVNYLITFIFPLLSVLSSDKSTIDNNLQLPLIQQSVRSFN